MLQIQSRGPSSLQGRSSCLLSVCQRSLQVLCVGGFLKQSLRQAAVERPAPATRTREISACEACPEHPKGGQLSIHTKALVWGRGEPGLRKFLMWPLFCFVAPHVVRCRLLYVVPVSPVYGTRTGTVGYSRLSSADPVVTIRLDDFAGPHKRSIWLGQIVKTQSNRFEQLEDKIRLYQSSFSRSLMYHYAKASFAIPLFPSRPSRGCSSSGHERLVPVSHVTLAHLRVPAVGVRPQSRRQECLWVQAVELRCLGCRHLR